jgi:hypothetical protein
LKPCFSDIPGKNDPHIGVLAGFMGSGWGKLGGESSLGLQGFPDKGMGNGAQFGFILVLLPNTPLFNIYEVN